MTDSQLRITNYELRMKGYYNFELWLYNYSLDFELRNV